MARLNEKQVAVARVYSRAMFDLAQSGDGVDALLEELEGLVQTLQQKPDLHAFFDSPLIEDRDRAEAIEKMFRGRASDLLVDSLQVLNRNDRLVYLETVVEIYRQTVQESRGSVDVHVTSAVPLSDEARQELTALAKRMFGRQPDLTETVDESLIGGLVVRVGDRKIDTSIATDLRRTRRLLADRAAQEIFASRRAAEA